MEPGGGAIRPIGGKALVIDADTIKVGEAAIRIRLDGIDAPELKQPGIAADRREWACGREAVLTLDDAGGARGSAAHDVVLRPVGKPRDVLRAVFCHHQDVVFAVAAGAGSVFGNGDHRLH